MKLSELFSKRLIFVSGKGGVGKTSVSVLLGMEAAAREKRTLIVEMNSTERVAPIFHRKKIGHEEVPLAMNLWAINLSPKHCFEDYAIKLIRFTTIYKAIFENAYVTNFLKAAPGLKEFLMLHKINMLEKTGKSMLGSRKKFDLIIVDAPATGHGLSVLEVPAVLAAVTRMGPLYTNAKSIMELLADKEKTVFCLVTMAEEMPVCESEEYVAALRKRTDLSFGPMFINSVMPKPKIDDIQGCKDFPEELAIFGSYHELSKSRYQLNQEYLLEIEKRFPDFNRFIIPFQFNGLRSQEHFIPLLDLIKGDEL